MNWHRQLVALFIMLALVGCAQVGAMQGQAPYAPYSHEDKGDMHDGGEGGSGSM